MTREQFIEEVKVHIKELVKTYDGKIQVAVIFINDDNPDENFHFGFGCPACVIERASDSIEAGVIKHNSEMEKIH